MKSLCILNPALFTPAFTPSSSPFLSFSVGALLCSSAHYSHLLISGNVWSHSSEMCFTSHASTCMWTFVLVHETKKPARGLETLHLYILPLVVSDELDTLFYCQLFLYLNQHSCLHRPRIHFHSHCTCNCNPKQFSLHFKPAVFPLNRDCVLISERCQSVGDLHSILCLTHPV